MNRILQRIASTTDSYSFDDVLKVYNNLSKNDQLLISPSGKFINSPNLIHRVIKFNEANIPIGFAEAYRYNGNSNSIAFVIIAVLKNYRGLGIGSYLLQSITHECFSKGYKKVIYKCETTNTSSAALAEKNGFKLIGNKNNELTFELNSHYNQMDYLNNYYTMRRNSPAMFYHPSHYAYPYYGWFGHNPYQYANNTFNFENTDDNFEDNSDNEFSNTDNFDNNVSEFSDGGFSGDGGDSGGE